MKKQIHKLLLQAQEQAILVPGTHRHSERMRDLDAFRADTERMIQVFELKFLRILLYNSCLTRLMSTSGT